MTVFRRAENQSRTGIHDTLEFLHVMVGNSMHRGDCCNSLAYWLVINA